MRHAIVLLLALAAPAAAGGYGFETIGGGSFQAGLAGRGARSGLRVQFGAGYTRGPWAIESSLTVYVPDDFFYIDCYGDECLGAPPATTGMGIINVDARHAWRVLHSTWTRKIGLDFVLHGGPRWIIGGSSLDGYRGPGLGGGATVDANFKIVSLFLDSGLDLGVLSHRAGDRLTAKIPYVTVGMRFGWM